MKHFVDDPNQLHERFLELLTNLNCPTVHDFRWYKDVFLEKKYESNTEELYLIVN